MVLEPGARSSEAKPNDTNSKIAAMVKLITNYGPQISRTARELRVHKETARYWYKKLQSKGYRIQAVPFHEKLGLKRVIVLAEFSEVFRPYADAILTAMSELCYLTSFSKTLPDDLYSIHANVPQERASEWIRFMHTLEGRGLFSKINAFPFEWGGVVQMHSEVYDFENDVWLYDWASRTKAEPESSNFAPTARVRFDLVDLNLIKQLQINPDASLVEIGNRLKMNYKTLTWHYRKHLIGRGLLRGYSVNWAGTQYDPKLARAMHRRHRYMWLELLVSNVTETERVGLMVKISRLPFVWFEAGGRNYFAQIAFPMETMTEALSFVKEVTSPVRQKAVWHFMDQANALRFSIAPNLYDQQAGHWKFDQMELLDKFDRLVLEIKGMTS